MTFNRIKKVIFSLILMTILFLPCTVSFSEAAAIPIEKKQDVTIQIDGDLTKEIAALFHSEGIDFISVRPVFEAFGSSVQWNQDDNTIIILKPAATSSGGAVKAKSDTSSDTADPNNEMDNAVNTIQLKVGAPYSVIDNTMREIKTPPIYQDGQLMISIDLAADLLNAAIKVDQKSNSLMIVTNQEENHDKKVNNTSKSRSSSAGVEETVTFLSYEDAVFKGVRASGRYISAQIDADRASSTNEDLYLSLNSMPAQVAQKKQVSLQDTWAEMNLDLTAQQIANDIKNQMDNISQLKRNLNLAKKSAAFQTEKYRIEQLKYENGMTSYLALDNIRLEKEKAEADITSLEKEIDAAYITFNTAVGLPTDTREELEYQISYDPGKVPPVSDMINRTIGEDPYLWFAKQNISLSDYSLNTYDYMVNYNMLGQSYTSVRLNLSTAKATSRECEKQLRKVIESRYNQLEQIDEKYKTALLTLETAEQQVKTAEIQYNAGNIVKLQLDEANLAVRKIVNSIEELQIKHAQALAIYEKPYLYPEYAAGGSSNS